ncbi:hypothetical protein HKD37_11G031543 [Glycine soja]
MDHLKLMNEEEQTKCYEMAKIMSQITRTSEEILNTVHAKEQPEHYCIWLTKMGICICCVQLRFGQPNHCLRVDSTEGFLSPDQRSLTDVNLFWSECILAGHIQNQQPSKIVPKMALIIPLSVEFGDFHGASESIQNYLHGMYYFMKDKWFNHLNLEDIVECHIVYNDGRKITKIGFGWKVFCQTQSFEPGIQIVFEFPDPTINYRKHYELAEIMMRITRIEEQMFNTLERHWHLVDKHGNMHDVVYNKDLISLTIIHGWTTLRTFYGLEGNHQVTLTHYGQGLFLLTIFKTSSDAKTFSKWYLLYHQVSNSITFKVLLDEYKVMCSNLNVVHNDWRKITKIGSDWRAFFEAQSFKPSMEIIFEFPYPNVNYALI